MSETVEIEVTCPECGDSFVTEVLADIPQGDFVEIECPSCGAKFHYD